MTNDDILGDADFNDHAAGKKAAGSRRITVSQAEWHLDSARESLNAAFGDFLKTYKKALGAGDSKSDALSKATEVGIERVTSNVVLGWDSSANAVEAIKVVADSGVEFGLPEDEQISPVHQEQYKAFCRRVGGDEVISQIKRRVEAFNASVPSVAESSIEHE